MIAKKKKAREDFMRDLQSVSGKNKWVINIQSLVRNSRNKFDFNFVYDNRPLTNPSVENVEEVEKLMARINKTFQQAPFDDAPHIAQMSETWRLTKNNIGYIQVLSFDDGIYNRFKECLDDLLSKNIKSLIIDLRDNGGGIVTEATNIADLFLDQNKCIMIEVNKNDEKEYINAENNATINPEMKVLILANENSASASEILIGSLKDNNVASIIGTRTYGKGVMQEIVPVSSGGALKVTIKEFRTPNDNRINENGITPDIEVEDNESTEKDEQLQMAIKTVKE